MFKNQKKLFSSLPFSIKDAKLFKASVTFLSNIIRTKLFNTNAKRGPLFISWLCTYQCNARCKFCSTHEMNKQFSESISREKALAIAHEIGRAKTWVVGFTGGEVLLWPHLFEVIKVLKRYGVRVYIITNGLILKNNVDNIIESGLDTVVVSIDSIDSREHDQNRGKEGIYSSIMEGIGDLKSKRKLEKPTIKSTTVISKKTYPEIEKTVDYLSGIVDVVSIQPVVTDYANGPHNISEEEKSSFFPEKSEESLVIETLRRLAKKYPSFNNFYFRNIVTYWFSPEKLLKLKCWSPFLRLLIMPHGEVSHCPANPKYSKPIGDLKTNSLMEIWNSPEMKHHREEIRKHQNNCICWSQDASFNAFLYSLPFMNKLPIFKKRS